MKDDRARRDADAIIANRGLKQISDAGAIDEIVDQVIAANGAIVAEVGAGKGKAINSRRANDEASKGKANPAQVNTILKARLAL